MDLTREGIVEGLEQILGAENVLTDEALLQERSIDNFRKLENIFGVHTLPPPAAVALVGSTEDVAAVLAFADEHGINVVPRTGGTATEGGLETHVPNSIVVDGGRMNEILSVDAYNMQATAQCGVPLQSLEDRARALGLTTGHSPQSKPVAHMGGLVATRSIGQLSTLYGGIEDMVVGLEAVFPGGEVTRIKNVPRRAAGPDIRHVVIGNEGALCFITEVTVKLFPYLPENNTYLGWTLKSMTTGFEVLREVMVAGYKPSVARLYDPEDGGIHFSHFAAADDCVLIFMAEGNPGIARATAEGIAEIVARHPGCVPVESAVIQAWFEDLTWGPEKIAAEDERIRTTRNVNRTTEISADWSSINAIYEAALPDPRRDPGDHDPRGPLVAQLHQRDEHVLQLLLRPRRRPAGGGGDADLPPDRLDHRRGDAPPRRLDRPPPRDRQGTSAVGDGRIRILLRDPREAEAGVRPERDHEQGHHHPRVTGQRVPTGDPESLRVAAVLAPLFRDAAGEVRTLLVVRTDHGPHGGQLGFPGGKPEPGDVDLLSTALREAEEEVGLDPTAVEVLAALPPLDTFATGFRVHAYVGRVAADTSWRLDATEVAGILTPPVSLLADPQARATLPFTSNAFPEPLLVEGVDVDGHVLWGMTLRLLDRMLPRLLAGEWVV